MTKRIPLVDLELEWSEVSPAVEAAIRRVLAERQFILGPAVDAFERDAAALLDVRHAIGVSSGSDALLAALMALGIGPGDEVVTTPFSFFATVECILRVGARPRFADVDRATLNLDPASAARAIGPRTRAVLPVHLFGRPASLEALVAVCEDARVALVEDAAQAFGVRRGGRAVGTWGLAGCFSFFPTKPLGALGDAGMVVTNDDEVGERLRALRVHGARERNEHHWVGGNFRLDALQAAALGAKLPRFEHRLEGRRALARSYDRALERLEGILPIAPDAGPERGAAVYAVRVPERREELRAFLARAGVETAIYYPIPLHQQPAVVAALGEGEPMPEAERAAREVLALPLYYGMPARDQARVVALLEEFFSGG